MMLRKLFRLFGLSIVLFALTSLALSVQAQPKGYNYDEAKVPQYTLPDALMTNGGGNVKTAKKWKAKRRAEVLELFEEHMYGRSPGRPQTMMFETLSSYRNAFGGKATRKEIRATFKNNGKSASMEILVFIPNITDKPAPVFLGLSFYGNHTVSTDPSIRLNPNWMRRSSDKGIKDHRATEKSRGTSASRWPVEQIIDRGYGVATIYCGDLDPDIHDGWKNGVHPLFAKEGEEHAPNAWGTIGAWAWGLSRAMDYFETDEDIDHARVAVLGHSRLGKTSLWAGAQDERFAFVISNNSGCGGAALSRRAFGETVKRINTSFPHWFCGNFKKYNDNEAALPLDQHMLIALMAPRPVYVASATGDEWADPNGEFLSAKHAESVYALFGKKGLGVEKQPAPDTPVGHTIGYHLRTGKHDINAYDWARYMDFADKHFAN